MFFKKTWNRKKITQPELNVGRQFEFDRNHCLGGRSFYFFDFDDNIAALTTSAFLFHKKTGEEYELTSAEFAQHSSEIGKTGQFADYEISFCDRAGTFRNYRDRDFTFLEKVLLKSQPFVTDLKKAIKLPDLEWKGPSWNCFYHAVFNHRPISLITARGHNPETIKKGFNVLIQNGYLPHEPNYLSIFPVNHPTTRNFLGYIQNSYSVPELKQAAIRASVEKAFKIYGNSSFHRFGMSDDDPKNIELIIEEMRSLKSTYPENSFYVIDTSRGRFIKREVFNSYIQTEYVKEEDRQLTLV